MTWTYQRHPIFKVLWKGALNIEPGKLAKFIGKIIDTTTLEAAVVIERNGLVHEQPDHEALNRLYPLEGKVFSCEQRESDTLISVYQTIPNLFSFPSQRHHRAFLMIPEFWNFLEDKSEWSDSLPGAWELRKLKKQRFQHPDIADTSWAIQRYGQLSGVLVGDVVQQVNGQVTAKLEQLFRLRRRAEAGNQLKLHLLTLSRSEGRSYMLDELVHEGPMTLEHGAYATYAVLDLVAHLVNTVLRLGVSELQTSFTAVLGKDSSLTESNLRSTHPNLDLTKFWLAEQGEWIADLREMRHEFAHRGAAEPVYGPNERLLATTFGGPETHIPPIRDVEKTITQWFKQAEFFFVESLRLLAEFCLEAVKPFETEPNRPAIKAPRPSSELEEVFRDTLRLLYCSNEEHPERIEHLYARLEPDWRKQWPLNKFAKFMDSLEGLSIDQRRPVEYSSSPDGHSATVKLLLLRSGRTSSWVLQLKKKGKGRPYLERSPMTVPTSLEPLTSIINYAARQSYGSCAEFRFTLTNTGAADLKRVIVLVTHSDLEVARTEIEQVQMGESIPIIAVTTPELGGILPPGGPYLFVILISETVVIRVKYEYENEYGNEWIDEHRCTNSAGAPLGGSR